MKMSDVRIEDWNRLIFDEMTDIVEMELNVYGNIIKVFVILSTDDKAMLTGAQIIESNSKSKVNEGIPYDPGVVEVIE